MFGGAFGSAARHLVSRATLALIGPGYPWGTLVVNVTGGFAMGVLAGLLARFGQGGEQWRLLLGVGVLGGYTTFSTFSLDAMVLIERGDWASAIGYAVASVIGAISALTLGLMVARAIARAVA